MTREEAIEIFKLLRQQDTRVEADDYEQALEMAISALEQKRQTGEWIVRDDLCSVRYYQCSECNELCFNDTDFCPNCGADMRGAE